MKVHWTRIQKLITYESWWVTILTPFFLLIVISFFTQVITHFNVRKLDVILKVMYLNNITLIHYDIVSKDVTIIITKRHHNC